MSDLASLGRIVRLDSIIDGLRGRIALRIDKHPGEFAEWLGHMLSANPSGNALIVTAGAAIAGDLVLDWTAEIRKARVTSIVALSSLAITGALVNKNLDGGPLLFVDGDLEVQRIEKGGANLVVLGSLRAQGPVLFEYNHGVVRIGGDLESEITIVLDQDVYVAGTSRPPLLDSDSMDLRGHLVPDVFAGPDDIAPDGDLIRARMAKRLALKTQ